MSEVDEGGIPSIIPVNLVQVSEIVGWTSLCKATHIIEDVDNDQDRHTQVKLP